MLPVPLAPHHPDSNSATVGICLGVILGGLSIVLCITFGGLFIVMACKPNQSAPESRRSPQTPAQIPAMASSPEVVPPQSAEILTVPSTIVVIPGQVQDCLININHNYASFVAVPAGNSNSNAPQLGLPLPPSPAAVLLPWYHSNQSQQAAPSASVSDKPRAQLIV